MKLNKIKKVATVVIIIIIVSFPAGYLIALNSEPYHKAVEFVTTHELVKERLGDVKSVHLYFFGYSIANDAGGYHASFKIALKGGQSNGVAQIKLEKDNSNWQIESAVLVTDSTVITLL